MISAADTKRLEEIFDLARSGDWQGALFRLKRLRDDGNSEAAFFVASVYESGGPGVQRNIHRAIELYEALADEHDPWAIAALGRLYFVGTDVRQDYCRASYYYRILSEAGEARAQFVLGDMYMRGLGVSKDETLARELFKLSANGGNVNAMRNVALLELRAGNIARGIWRLITATITRLRLRWSDRSSERLWRI